MNRRVRTGLRLPVLLPAVMLLGACQGIPANLPADPAERVMNDDRVQVNLKLTVHAQNASVILQHGRIVTGAADRFEASCRFVLEKSKNTPQTIVPGAFRVTNVRYWEDFVIPDIRQFPFSGGEMINYEITLRLHSAQQPEVHSLVCRHDDDSVDGRHLKLSEMQLALGDFARLIKTGVE